MKTKLYSLGLPGWGRMRNCNTVVGKYRSSAFNVFIDGGGGAIQRNREEERDECGLITEFGSFFAQLLLLLLLLVVVVLLIR